LHYYHVKANPTDYRNRREPTTKETTISELVLIDHRDDSPRANSSGNVLPDSHDHEDVLPVHLQSRVEADTSQQLALAEMEVEPRRTPGMTLEARDPINDIAKLWGKAYALAPEGSELNIFTNNAQRREEISNICLEHVIEGKRLRTAKKKLCF
jgi:hypothetical protein